VVYCGDESAGTLAAFGFAEFTITAAAAPAAGPQQPRPASTVPVLANTGSDNGILAAVAAAMLLAGAGLIAVRRRLV
jgi:LPXTG-motif cell wall-anchored protein